MALFNLTIKPLSPESQVNAVKYDGSNIADINTLKGTPTAAQLTWVTALIARIQQKWTRSAQKWYLIKNFTNGFAMMKESLFESKYEADS